MSASVTDRFLSEIDKIIEAKDGQQLRNYLVIEPPYGNLYASMIVELRHQFSKGSETVLETRCTSYLAITHGSEEDLPWSAFVKFIVQYLIFLRDVDTNNLLNTYNSLSELVQSVRRLFWDMALADLRQKMQQCARPPDAWDLDVTNCCRLLPNSFEACNRSRQEARTHLASG